MVGFVPSRFERYFPCLDYVEKTIAPTKRSKQHLKDHKRSPFYEINPNNPLWAKDSKLPATSAPNLIPPNYC